MAIKGPAAAEVGTDARFTIEVTNLGDTPATNILVSDQFDAGLEHSVASSPIETNLPDIGPRQTGRIAVTPSVTQPGQLCQDVTVTAAGDLRGAARSCITAVARPGGPPAIAPPDQTPTSPPAVIGPATPPRAGGVI